MRVNVKVSNEFHGTKQTPTREACQIGMRYQALPEQVRQVLLTVCTPPGRTWGRGRSRGPAVLVCEVTRSETEHLEG